MSVGTLELHHPASTYFRGLTPAGRGIERNSSSQTARTVGRVSESERRGGSVAGTDKRSNAHGKLNAGAAACQGFKGVSSMHLPVMILIENSVSTMTL